MSQPESHTLGITPMLISLLHHHLSRFTSTAHKGKPLQQSTSRGQSTPGLNPCTFNIPFSLPSSLAPPYTPPPFPLFFTYFFFPFFFWPSCPKALLCWLVPDVPLSSSCRLNIPQLETAHTLKHTLLLTPYPSPFPLNLSPTHRAKRAVIFFFFFFFSITASVKHQKPQTEMAPKHSSKQEDRNALKRQGKYLMRQMWKLKTTEFGF